MRAARDLRPPDTFDALQAQIAALTARVAVLEAGRAVSGLSRKDRARLVRLLPAIAGAIGTPEAAAPAFNAGISSRCAMTCDPSRSSPRAIDSLSRSM